MGFGRMMMVEVWVSPRVVAPGALSPRVVAPGASDSRRLIAPTIHHHDHRHLVNRCCWPQPAPESLLNAESGAAGPADTEMADAGLVITKEMEVEEAKLQKEAASETADLPVAVSPATTTITIAITTGMAKRSTSSSTVPPYLPSLHPR